MTNPDPYQEFKLLGPDGELIMHGSMSAVMEPLLDTKARADALQLLDDAARSLGLIEQQQDQAEQLRDWQLGAFCDGVAAIGRRLDAMEARRAEQARAAAAAEARQIQDALAALPDPDAPDPFAPSGDLHAVPPLEPHREQLQHSDQGELPPELIRKVLSALGPDPSELAHPQIPSQRSPVAVSLSDD